uniref:Putative ovule protein n=1 Tax=Solanum chacoense TaxID=4108 RepID=A0A0V0I7L8_SOLCH
MKLEKSLDISSKFLLLFLISFKSNGNNISYNNPQKLSLSRISYNSSHRSCKDVTVYVDSRKCPIQSFSDHFEMTK